MYDIAYASDRNVAIIVPIYDIIVHELPMIS